jgi:hypothetical protein
MVNTVELAVCLLFLGDPTDRALAGWCPPRKTRSATRYIRGPRLADDQALIASLIGGRP